MPPNFKGNNKPVNLKALCMACHRKQPMHTHIIVKHEYMKIITHLRNNQKIINTGWNDVFKYVDSSLVGLLYILKHKRWEPPEIGVTISNISGDSIFLDIAWTKVKKGICIRNITENQFNSWQLYCLSDMTAEHAITDAHFKSYRKGVT